jgi:hypothetical protein
MKQKILDLIKNNNIKNWQIFILLVTLDFLQEAITNNFVFTKETYHILLAPKMESYQIDNIFIIMKRNSTYSYLFIPVILLIRILTVTMLIQLFFLFGRMELKLKEVFRIASYGVIILLIGSLVKSIWLMSIPREQLTIKMFSHMPLSLTNLVNPYKMDHIMVGLFNSINIFEILWILTIGFLIKLLYNIKFTKSVIYSLGVWVLVLIFQTGLNLYVARVFHG